MQWIWLNPNYWNDHYLVKFQSSFPPPQYRSGIAQSSGGPIRTSRSTLILQTVISVSSDSFYKSSRPLICLLFSCPPPVLALRLGLCLFACIQTANKFLLLLFFVFPHISELRRAHCNLRVAFASYLCALNTKTVCCGNTSWHARKTQGKEKQHPPPPPFFKQV